MIRILAFLFLISLVQGIGAEEAPLFVWDLLWTGSWYKSIKTPDSELPPTDELFSGGTFYNRGNISLALPAADLSFRLMATDKRLLPPEEDDGKAGFNPGFGVYHLGSGSRFIYGVQSEYGLPARVNNVWLRSAPFMESRSPSSRDLKTEPSAQDTPQSYLFLALPKNAPLSAFVSAALDEEMNPAFGGGAGFGWSDMEFRFEGFYAARKLPPRVISTWFSSSPPLPERDFNIYALGMLFNSPFFAIASDWALSETFAWGRGLYGNFSLRLGNKPWRFSLSGDGAGGRFADRGGSMAGSGFRVAAKGEYFRPRSGLLRFQGTLRSPGLDESFNRGSFSAYFRPSAQTAAEKRKESFPLSFTRASIGLNRDARNPGKTGDVLDALAGFSFGPFSSVFSFSLHNISFLDADNGSLFQAPVFENFDSFKVSAEFGWKPSVFDIKTRVGYTSRAEKDPVLDLSLNVSVRPGKWGRVGLKIASTDFPEKWNYTLSWRFNIKH
jgi:hypothetical protein